MVVQWLERLVLNAGGSGSIPGHGTRSDILQPRVCMPQLKTQSATTKTWHRKINKHGPWPKER